MRGLCVCLAAGALLLTAACEAGVSEPAATAISAFRVAERIEAGARLFLLDVRSRAEFARGHVPGAINIPYDELPSRLAELPLAKAEEIIVYCQSGRRAQIASTALQEAGHSNVRDLEGHWAAWRAAARPTE